MQTFIVLYRGINVVGRNSLKMELLRAMHERLGHKNVQSYIASGNILLTANGSPELLARKSAAAFADAFGFAAKLLVVDIKRWNTIVQGNPYARAAAVKPNTVHLGICTGAPDAQGLNALLARTGTTERFAISHGAVYLHAPDGFGTSKFAAGMEKASGVAMTVRNWRTVETIWRMTTEGTKARRH